MAMDNIRKFPRVFSHQFFFLQVCRVCITCTFTIRHSCRWIVFTVYYLILYSWYFHILNVYETIIQ